MDFPFSLTQPLGLLLLLLIVPTVLIGRQSLAYLPKARRRASTIARVVMLVLMALSLSGLQLVTAADNLAVVFLLDRSDSVGPAQRVASVEVARQALGRMGDKD